MLSRNLIIGLIIAALVLIILGMGSCYSQRIENLKNENRALEQRDELNEELVDGLDNLSSRTTAVRDVETRGYEIIDDVAEERPEDNGEILPRMRRADRAWRAVIECMRDDACSDPDVGAAEELPAGAPGGG